MRQCIFYVLVIMIAGIVLFLESSDLLIVTRLLINYHSGNICSNPIHNKGITDERISNILQREPLKHFQFRISCLILTSSPVHRLSYDNKHSSCTENSQRLITSSQTLRSKQRRTQLVIEWAMTSCTKMNSIWPKTAAR